MITTARPLSSALLAPKSLVGQIWIRENRVSSYGMSRLVELAGLSPESQELLGELVHANGRSRLNGVFKWEPTIAGSRVTQDGFDQVEMYVSLDQVQRYLMGLGLDVPRVVANRHEGKGHAVVSHANAVPDMNAWYSPQSDDLSFGSSNDKWHLASDADIVVHEYGHLLLDHIAPGLSGRFAGEGASIHEAFGDALASLYHNDPELAEDFGPAIGKRDNPAEGLRTVNNVLTIDQAGTEPHDRSLAYSGFFWQLKTQLMHPRGMFRLNDRVAANFMLQLLVSHAYFYTTRTPKPKDFVTAVLSAIDQMDKQKTLPVDRAALRKLVIAEAQRRNMVTEPEARALEYEVRPVRNTDDFGADMKQFGPSIQFVSAQKTPADWGETEYMQQVVSTRSHGSIEVAGGGVAVWRDTGGSVIDYSLDDVRSIAPGSIDETVNTDYKTAVQRSLTEAQKRLTEKTAVLQKIYAQGGDPRAVAAGEMEVRIVKTSIDALNRMAQTPAAAAPKYIMVPGKDTLHYELKLGLEIAYIDAKTGDVSFHKDVFTF